jgi:hypothetical protein
MLNVVTAAAFHRRIGAAHRRCRGRFVDQLGDVFELTATPRGTQVTRTTTVTVRGFGRAALYPALWVGLKSVHRFVFRNWQKMRLSPAATV